MLEEVIPHQTVPRVAQANTEPALSVAYGPLLGQAS